ncbi:START domain-containing protein [Chitinophagaceae bacterium LB-8]|uniref:START domain-containing protein n=1 Tax=Paraflavisolibacter caeni TaxID=2982496 RepID=A0A9X2XZU6_9BACT|nr:START domain-containing protein [Paraflavisolibacter caeni]MCU7551971.1 START domain-containing protein [Paraflavisolibacter caeni]
MKAKYLNIFCWLLFLGITADAQVPSGANWHLVKEGNGIKVYTAPSPSGFKYIKVNAELNGTLNKVIEVFRDIASQKDWVFKTRKANLIKKIDDNNFIYYNETSLPWPASDRDIAIHMNLEEGPSNHDLTITQKEAPDATPVKKGIVRVPHLSGTWKFRNTDKGKLHAEYYLDIDPGGSLPAWIVNMFSAKGPYETFVNLQKMIRE